MWKSSTASSPLPRCAIAITVQIAAWVYWPPFSRTAGRALRVPARSHQRGEIVENLRQEPAEPDALAAALVSDAVHAVVPVAGADHGKSVRADREPTLDGADAVLVECSALP